MQAAGACESGGGAGGTGVKGGRPSEQLEPVRSAAGLGGTSSLVSSSQIGRCAARAPRTS
jgi:hypothetical protein